MQHVCYRHVACRCLRTDAVQRTLRSQARPSPATHSDSFRHGCTLRMSDTRATCGHPRKSLAHAGAHGQDARHFHASASIVSKQLCGHGCEFYWTTRPPSHLLKSLQNPLQRRDRRSRQQAHTHRPMQLENQMGHIKPSENHPKNKKRKEKEATAKANPQPRTTQAQRQTKPTQNKERTKRCSISN